MKPTTDDSQLVATFLLGDAAFGIGTEHIQEVVKVGDITPVHHAPPYIVGIRNLGAISSRSSTFALRLELGAVTPGPESRIIIVDWKGEPIGLLVDSVADTMSIDKKDITPPPPNVHGIQGRNFVGVYRSKERIVALLDLGTVLQVENRAEKPRHGRRDFVSLRVLVADDSVLFRKIITDAPFIAARRRGRRQRFERKIALQKVRELKPDLLDARHGDAGNGRHWVLDALRLQKKHLSSSW
jgi:purine-binding chemotaxis protein CheW